MDESPKKGVASAQLMRRLQGRARLMALAAEPSREVDPELARLKSYLSGWATGSEPRTLVKGAPGEVPYSDYMRPGLGWDIREEDDRLDASIRRALDEAVDELSGALPLCRPCLMVRYMNLRGPAVYRHGRLHHLSRDEIEDLADESERRLVPIVKRRGVVL